MVLSNGTKNNNKKKINLPNFRQRRWGSSLPCPRTRDTPLSPPSTLAEIFRHACLQSRFHQISPFSGQNRVNWGCRGDSPNIFFFGFLIFLLLRSSCKISKLQNKPFWEKQPISAFVRPKSAFLGGLGGSPKFYFHWNPNIFVTQEPLQHFKTVEQTLLGETAHFGFCPPKIGFFGGLGGVPEIFFSLESSYFCELRAHAKF